VSGSATLWTADYEDVAAGRVIELSTEGEIDALFASL
jgi:hypothetical protein